MADIWDLLDVTDCDTDIKKKIKAWNYYNEEYVQQDVNDFDGNLIRGFTEAAFAHIISGSSNYRTIPTHDIDVVTERLVRIPWIKPTLSASSCHLEVRKDSSLDSRNRRRINRLLLVVDKQYIVVIDENQEDFWLRTAYPANSATIERKRRNSILIKEFGE